MRFVSRSANYTMIVRSETEYEVFETAEGTMIPRTVRKPMLLVEFKHGMAHPDESYAAMAHWAGQPTKRTDPERLNAAGVPTSDVYGAVPYQRGVSIQDGVGRIIGVSGASRPDFNFSLFDSEWLEDLDDRKEAEQALLNNADNNVWYVKVDAVEVPAPWPNYNKLRAAKGSTVAETIATKCVEDGYDIAYVLEYEKAHADRPAVIAALEAALSKALDNAEADAALVVEVG